MSDTVLDPYEVATQVAENSGVFFGKMETQARFISGFGKNPPEWVQGMDPATRKTQIELRVNPIDEMQVTFLVMKTMTAEFSDWQAITWPSMRDMGCKTPRDLHGKFVQVKLVNGREYKDKTTGETKQPTVMKILAVYENQAECVKAWEAQSGGNVAHTPTTTPAPAVSLPNDAEKAVAASFLPYLVNAAAGDLIKLAQNLASMSPCNKYFTVDSPEVQALLKVAA